MTNKINDLNINYDSLFTESPNKEKRIDYDNFPYFVGESNKDVSPYHFHDFNTANLLKTNLSPIIVRPNNNIFFNNKIAVVKKACDINDFEFQSPKTPRMHSNYRIQNNQQFERNNFISYSSYSIPHNQDINNDQLNQISIRPTTLIYVNKSIITTIIKFI